MARTAWSVDGHRLEYLGRGALLVPGGLLIDGVKDEQCRVKLSRPDYEFWVGRRRLVLKTLGDGGELWSGQRVIAPSEQHVVPVPAPAEAKCAQHADAGATIACARCGTFACAHCEGPDGTHCASCLPGTPLADSDEPAGPAAALREFGGPIGKVIALADSQLERHVASLSRRRWIRLAVYGSIAVAVIWWIASKAPSA